MKLYHGSYITVKDPQVSQGRTKVDFGQGFYLTSLKGQAENWSRIISIRKGPGHQPMVSVFELAAEAFNDSTFRIKRFPEYDIEWLDYVVDCRQGGSLHNQYDLIEGGVANDKVIDTVEDYETGRITAEQALGQLRYKQVTHQICIRNQQLIQKYLTFETTYPTPSLQL